MFSVYVIKGHVCGSQRLHSSTVAAMSARLRSRSRRRECGCLCKQHSWCTLMRRRVSGITIDCMSSKEFPSNMSMTSAAGAEWLRAYTSEKVAVDIPIDATSEITLNCLLSKKNEAKQLGAKWNPTLKTWYVPARLPLASFGKWLPRGMTCGHSWSSMRRLALDSSIDFATSTLKTDFF